MPLKLSEVILWDHICPFVLLPALLCIISSAIRPAMGRLNALHVSYCSSESSAGADDAASSSSDRSSPGRAHRHSLDDYDVPHQVSEPAMHFPHHGRHRSRSLVQTPRRSLLDKQDGNSWFSASETRRLHKADPLFDTASPTRQPFSSRAVLASSPRRKSFADSPLLRSKRDATPSVQAGAAARMPRDALSALVETPPKPTRIQDVVDGLWSRVDAQTGQRAAAGGRTQHRARSCITPSVTDTVPGATTSAFAALSVPVKGMLPDVIPEPRTPVASDGQPTVSCCVTLCFCVVNSNYVKGFRSLKYVIQLSAACMTR